jgi:transposase InsO family protein
MTLLVEQAVTRHGPELLQRLCRAIGLCRSTFYRRQRALERADVGMALRDAIQKIALKFSCYGYRRIAEELKRQGWQVNYKRVLRLMRLDNLLCLRKRRFIATTDSAHALPVYPNLARDLHFDGPNQLWVADITYIRLRNEFIYLAVVLDAYSRRCIGWALDRRIDASLCVEALRMALKCRMPPPGLVHHSDRGVQYASKEYTGILTEAGAFISMSRKANPYDNAYAESFMKTLKYEEVYLNEYQNMNEARGAIAYFLEDVYNKKRLHSALGYLPPAEFERNAQMLAASSGRAIAQAAMGQSLATESNA